MPRERPSRTLEASTGPRPTGRLDGGGAPCSPCASRAVDAASAVSPRPAERQIEGPEGYADWVDAWSDHYEVLPRVDAALLGGGMYPGYEAYWTAIRERPDEPIPMTAAPSRWAGKMPTPGEVDYARFTA